MPPTSSSASASSPAGAGAGAAGTTTATKTTAATAAVTAAAAIAAAGTLWWWWRRRQASTSGREGVSTIVSDSASVSDSTNDSIGNSAADTEATLVRVGTRTSQLAMWQANLVADLLRARARDDDARDDDARDDARARAPRLDVRVLGMNTTGDVDQGKPLTAFDNKGVFTKELDHALLAGTIDVAVHCMKDLPTVLPTGLYLAAALERGDVEDAVVFHPKYAATGTPMTLARLPAGAVIGTSALRRRAAIGKYYPHLRCEDVRGNVNTRLMKLDRGDYDALILARTGLRRLGYDSRIGEVLDPSQFGYAVGQGALAILTRENDTRFIDLVAPLEHAPTRLVCESERVLLRTLQGGCKVPITVRSRYSREHNGGGRTELLLWASVLSLDGRVSIEHTGSTSVQESGDGSDGSDGVVSSASARAAQQLGQDVGEALLASGADAILREIR